MALIKCKECGQEISKNAKICPHCGKKNKNKKVWFLIVGAIILFLIIANIFSSNKEKKESELEENTSNINQVDKIEETVYGNEPYNMTSYNNNILQYENWIIFSNGSIALNAYISNFKDGIYKYNIETGQVIQLYNSNGYCLNLIDESLYFSTKFNDVYKININSLEEKWISSIDSSYLFVNDKNIFYRDPNGNNIYKTNLKGENKELIAEYTENEIQIDGDYIYYLDAQNYNLFKKNIKTKEIAKIIDETISNFYVTANKVIYKSKETLKILNCEQGTTEILKEGITSNFTFNNNKVYMYTSNNKSIVELNLENRQEQIIIENLEKDIYRLQMYNDNLYYSYSTGTYPLISTSLYKANINDKTQEKISFNTK